MDEPATADTKLLEDNLTESEFKEKAIDNIPEPSSESSISGNIPEVLENVSLETLNETERAFSLAESESKTLSPPKEDTFQVSLEPKPTETPPLLLFESKSQVLEDDSVFSGDLSKIPDQILAESPKHEELDERTENEIASNIEEQLREFEGSEDEMSLDKPINIEQSTANSDITRPEDIFGDDVSGEAQLIEKSNEPESREESKVCPATSPIIAFEETKKPEATFEGVDVSLAEEKIANIEEADVLLEDCTQTVLADIHAIDDFSNTEQTSQNQEDESNEKLEVGIGDNPPDECTTEESPAGSLNQTMDFEDVEMRLADDSKEKSDILLDSDDPLSKSDRDETEKPNEENLEPPKASVSELMEVDEKHEGQMSASGTIDSFEDNDAKKNISVHVSETQDTKEKNLEDPETESQPENISIQSDMDIQKEVIDDIPDAEDNTFETNIAPNTEPISEVNIPAENVENTECEDDTNAAIEEINALLQQEARRKSITAETGNTTSKRNLNENEDIDAKQHDTTKTCLAIIKDVVEEDRLTANKEIHSVVQEKESTSTTTAGNGSTPEEGAVDEIVQPVQPEESEEVCLLPDSEKELTGAEKEQAILARENAEKEAEKAEKTKAGRMDTRQSTPSEEVVNEEDHIVEELEIPQENVLDLNEYEIKELNQDVRDEKCYKCRKAKPCKYKFLRNGELKYLCDIKCVNSFRNTSKDVYTLTARKIIISSILGAIQSCVRCRAKKPCMFRFKDPDTGLFSFLCQPNCLNTFIGKNVEKYLVRRKKYIVEEMSHDTIQKCIHCGENKSCKYSFKQEDEFLYICNEDCFNLLSKEEPERYRLKQRRSVRVRSELGPQSALSQPEPEPKIVARTEEEAEAARVDREASFVRRCAHCFHTIAVTDRTLYWETADFCNELCLGKYQNVVGSSCQMCKSNVPLQSLGKYCVRFGFDIRQFCCTTCLDRFKKGLKVCSFCQRDISKSKEGFLAPVGDKGQFKDFCSQSCMTRYDEVCNPRKKSQMGLCAVCNNDKIIRVEIMLDNREQHFCSNPCFSAFKFVNNIYPDQCGMCLKYFERKSCESYTIYTDKTSKVFCCKICMNIFITLNRKIVPCQWCKVKKYNFDMIQKQCGPQSLILCSLNCLTLYGVSLNAISMRQQNCDQCGRQATPQYHLTMSDASMRNFCTYQCVMMFQSQFGRTPWTLDGSGGAGTGSKEVANKKSNAPFPTGLPKRVKGKAQQAIQPPLSSLDEGSVPIISNVASLAHSSDCGTSNESVIIKPLRKGRTRVITTRPETSPTQSNSPQPPLEGTEDDQPLVRLRSLRSGGAQNPQLQNIPSQESSKTLTTPPATPPITPKVITTNSHTQTKPVQKKSVGINAVIETEPVESEKPQMVDKSTMSMEKSTPTPERYKLRDRDKSPSEKVEYKTQVVTMAPPPPQVANKQTMCKPATATKSISCRPHPCSVQCQTEDDVGRKILIPVPVPIYVPQPMYMYSAPFPVPVPIPLPIPVPIFIPTTRNSAEGILKEIKKIQDKMPTDPFEAELLMMAEMVAGDKKKNESDSDSEQEAPPPEVEYHQPEAPEPPNTFGEDVLQMALKMATECDEPAVDLESAMTANTISQPATAPQLTHEEPDDTNEMQHQMIMIDGQRQIIRGRKRPVSPVSPASQPKNNKLPVTSPNKRQRRAEIQVVGQCEPATKEPMEKPDANMCLKYTFGVNAWKQWVMTKNADLEKCSIKRKPFKSELLQLTADELNYSLCLFVKEVRKPNGSEYAPDTIYYLVLGIQQYLYENGRIDNIFTDPYYERFTDCLDEVAKRFSILYNDSQYIVTRVEEEHLWECKQLGAHSPHVLLSTLMFFNTKHFNLTSVEEHMQLSFSHIMKHWKRSPPGTKTPGTRNVLLRFYPPQSGLDANPRKKKVYEQQENEENPLRCPVKLYEFYLSKCPESVKTRNDVFYLQPERSCVPDSPVWYSTQALSREALSKMLHRVKMVKEINIALLTS